MIRYSWEKEQVPLYSKRLSFLLSLGKNSLSFQDSFFFMKNRNLLDREDNSTFIIILISLLNQILIDYNRDLLIILSSFFPFFQSFKRETKSFIFETIEELTGGEILLEYVESLLGPVRN